MRALLFLVLMVVLSQAHTEEAYTGKLLHRDGLFYKPLQTEPFSGSYQRWYENRQLAAEHTYSNGKQEGLARMWHENGQPWSEATHKDGQQEGLARTWYENGQLQLELTAVGGKQEGLTRAWLENGDLLREQCYSNGEEVDMSNCQ